MEAVCGVVGEPWLRDLSGWASGPWSGALCEALLGGCPQEGEQVSREATSTSDVLKRGSGFLSLWKSAASMAVRRFFMDILFSFGNHPEVVQLNLALC